MDDKINEAMAAMREAQDAVKLIPYSEARADAANAVARALSALNEVRREFADPFEGLDTPNFRSRFDG